jgi:hypothetical protein
MRAVAEALSLLANLVMAASLLTREIAIVCSGCQILPASARTGLSQLSLPP